MRSVPADKDKGLAEPRNCAWDEDKGVTNVVVNDVQGVGSSDASALDKVGERVNNGSGAISHVPAGSEDLQPQGPSIHWERFLPKKSLKVLLVENDDSTRHVVSALLRNCSYEVRAVANGIQAWRILEDMTNHIDLVLTEVVMPFLSGIPLLCKIVNHKAVKNIPVIMMSPHDSMGLVFRCLSKGAVDFLVKPIRKNELKNLWHHVWRRCHSSSGSGSVSGTETKMLTKSENNDDYPNNTGSSDTRHDADFGLRNRDESSNGSGTQSLWTERAAELYSPLPVSPRHQLADTPDSICAQGMYTKPETCSDQRILVSERKYFPEQDEKLGNVSMVKALAIHSRGNPDSRGEYQHNYSTQPINKRQSTLPELDSGPLETEQPEHKCDTISGKLKDPFVDLNIAISSDTNLQVESLAAEAPNDLSNVLQIKYKACRGFRKLPCLELTLKGERVVGDAGTSANGEHHALKHSDLSAFSKYKTASSTSPVKFIAQRKQAPTSIANSCSPAGNSLVARQTVIVPNSDNTPPEEQSDWSSNNNDATSTIEYVVKTALDDKPGSLTASKCLHSTAFQHMQNGCICDPRQLLSSKSDDVVVDADQVLVTGSNQNVQVQHHHHHYHHHHHHHVQNMQNQTQLDHDDVALKNKGAAASECGSSDMLGGPLLRSGGYYGVNKSTSGSKHGSNEQNVSSKDLNAGGQNVESDNGRTGNSKGIRIGIKESGKRADEDHLVEREAASIKLRQKRKERCFEKRVDYRSRKKLADHRPRVKGQFVQHTMSVSKEVKGQQDSLARKGNSCDSAR